MRSITTASIVLLASSTTFARSITTTWIGGPTGSWNVAGNWSPTGVPNNGGPNIFDVIVDGNSRNSASITTTGINPVISTLTIGAGDGVTIPNGHSFYLTGGLLANEGTFTIGSFGGTTDFRVETNTLFTGEGVVAGTNTTANRLYGVGPAVRLTNSGTHTIAGSMQLGANQLRLTNEGLVEADLPGGISVDLTDGAGINFNSGTMRSTAGAKLTVFNTTLENAGGLIEAGPGSAVDVNSSTLIGGTLRDADGDGTGFVRTVGEAWLNNITVQGPYLAINGTTTRLFGSPTIEGRIDLASAGGTTDLIINTSPLTLTGGGSVAGSNTTANRFYGLGPTHTLVVAPDFTIRGSMQLGANQMRLDNQGLIQADLSGGLNVDLADGAGINFNSGTMRSTAGAKLSLIGSTIDNTDGVIEAGPGSAVDVNSSTLIGGTLRDADGDGTGFVRTVGEAWLNNITVQGPYLAINGTTTRLFGSPTVEGRIDMASAGGTTDLIINTSPLTLTGGGSVAGSNTTANRFYGLGPTHTLVVAPDFTIRGSMQLGANQMRLDNQGLIQADLSGGINVDLADGVGTNFNSGTMRSTAGAKLTVLNTTIDNTDGLIEAGPGAAVDVNSSTLIGGTLRDADGDGPGFVRTVGEAWLNNITVQGPYSTPNGTTTRLFGSPTIEGRINIASAGGTTDLIINTSPLTLTGGGSVVGSNTTANRFYGLGPTHMLIIAPDFTVRGSMQLGANQMRLTNNGLILADASGGMNIDATDSIGFVNGVTGTVEALGGNISFQPAAFDNQGTIIARSGRTISRAGQFAQSDGRTIAEGTISATGTPAFAFTGGEVIGDGVLTGSTSNTGAVVRPGPDDESLVGTLDITGTYTQGTEGILAVDLAVGGNDRLAITGSANVAGKLFVSFVDGFTPTVGQSFTILTASSVGGIFNCVTSETLPNGAVQVTYGPTSITVSIVAGSTNPADLTGDGEVNSLDLALLLGGWGAACTSVCCPGDINGDGNVDAIDLAIMLGAWS
ncbi:MAG: hypothetical protein JNL80_02220 [Phycisphaerae bacterium]|nr:hypothetical protein [Phycisphaerae bacterium]